MVTYYIESDVKQIFLCLIYIQLINNKSEINLLELYSRKFILTLHRAHTKLLLGKEIQRGLLVSIIKFPRCSFNKATEIPNPSTSKRRFAEK